MPLWHASMMACSLTYRQAQQQVAGLLDSSAAVMPAAAVTICGGISRVGAQLPARQLGHK